MPAIEFQQLPESVWCGPGVDTQGNHYVIADRVIRYIYPKLPPHLGGKSIRVTLQQNYLHLRHSTSGTIVSFKSYRHQGRWYWADSRDQNPDSKRRNTTRAEIISEIARILFKGDKNQATALVAAHLDD